jgi:hypothetical protein
MTGGEPGVGSAREEAERLVAAGLGAVSVALQGMEARRQFKGLAEQVFGHEQIRDLAAGLSGFVSGVTPPAGPATPGDEPWAAATAPDAAGEPTPPAAAGSDPAGTTGAAGPTGAAQTGAPQTGGPAETGGGTEHAERVAHGPRFSTGSADCCICPVCRVIAALRDPSPELADRLAGAVGDVAVGLAGILRAFDSGTPGNAWRDATRGDAGPDIPRAREEPRDEPAPPKKMAKKAVRKAPADGEDEA